jgi:hypothetical protein
MYTDVVSNVSASCVKHDAMKTCTGKKCYSCATHKSLWQMEVRRQFLSLPSLPALDLPVEEETG